MYDASQFPKVIEGINWATRTFDNRGGATAARAPETPKPLKPKEKKPVIIEVMPGEPLPEGYSDYRPLLQRDGLILLAWEIYGDDHMRIVWVVSSGGMRRYQARTDDESELSTICPDKRYDDDHWGHNEKPDFIIYTAPPELTINTKNTFIARLKASGALIDFNYEFSLGKQKTEKEMAVFDRIDDRKYLTEEETELLEAYRQLSDEGKMELINSMESLLNEQKAIIKNDEEGVTA